MSDKRYPYAWVYYAKEVDDPFGTGWYWTAVAGEGDFGMDHGPWPTREEAARAVPSHLPIRSDDEVM